MTKQFMQKLSTTNDINNTGNNPHSESTVQRGVLFPHLSQNIIPPAEYQRLDGLSEAELVTLIGHGDSYAAMYLVFYLHMGVIDNIARSFARRYSCDLESFKAQMLSELALAFDKAGWGAIAEKNSAKGWVIRIIRNTACRVSLQETNAKRKGVQEGTKYVNPLVAESTMIWGEDSSDDCDRMDSFRHADPSTFQADSYDTHQAVGAYLDVLSPAQRRIVELRHIEGLSSEQTAQVMSQELGRPIKGSNIDNQMSRSIKKMRHFALRDAA